MNIAVFITLIAIFSVISGFLTQGIKVWYQNRNKQYSSNMIALFNSFIIGFCGTPIAYILMHIPFTLESIACIPLMVGAVWLGCMIGYDKIMQLVSQVMVIKKEK